MLRSPRGKVRLRFSAAKLYLIAGAPQPAPVRVGVECGAGEVHDRGPDANPATGCSHRHRLTASILLALEPAAPAWASPLFSATFG